MQRTTLVILTITMASIAMLVPTNAYHIDGDSSRDEFSTHVWEGVLPIPRSNFYDQIATGSMGCEDAGGGIISFFPQGDPVGPIDVETGISANGNGGLCYMSSGSAIDSRSDGSDPCGGGAGPKFYSPIPGSAASCADNWVEIDMCQYNPGTSDDRLTGPECDDDDDNWHPGWTAQIDIYSCYVPQGFGVASFYYHELFAFYMDKGHVRGEIDLLTVVTSSDPDHEIAGTYGVDSTSVEENPGVSCDEPAPMYVDDESGSIF